MKKIRRATSLILAAVLVAASLTACGSKSEESGSSSSDTFKIGGIGPTTGDAAVY